jgi:hypothetical protein
MATAPSSNRTLNTTNQATISALFRVVNRYVGNVAPMPGVFPDYTAPIVRAGRKHEAAAITPYSGSIVFNPHGVKRHTAFRAASNAEVDAFYSSDRDKASGLRTGNDYPSGYYAAFLLDPDGNNIEAVCRS